LEKILVTIAKTSFGFLERIESKGSLLGFIFLSPFLTSLLCKFYPDTGGQR
jgi:hypothetical protein